MGVLFAVLGAALLYMIQVLLYERYWNKDLVVTVDFMQDVLTEKEQGQLREVITNEKLLPLPMLRVKFQVDNSFHFEQEGNISISDRCYKNDIFSILFYQKITRTLTFEAKKRGYYTIDQIDIVSTDLFMRANLVGTISNQTALYVFPRYVDYERLQIPFRSMMGTILTKQYAYEDPFEFRGIRSYQPFDNRKNINWNASAKTGELKVNLHDYTAKQEVCILLNLEQDSVLVYEQLKEESIRIASTLADLFIAQGIMVSLHGNGHDLLTKEHLNIPAGAGYAHLITIQEWLARIDLSQECEEYGDMLEKYIKQAKKQVLYILISSSLRVSIQRSFQQICSKDIDFANKSGSLWIVPLYEDMKLELTENIVADVLRWEVTRVEA